MSVALAVWHFVPWYTWPLLVVAVILLIEVPGALAAFVKIARAVPRWVYASVAGAIVFGVWLQWHDDGIRDADAKHEAASVAARNAYWKKREDDSNTAHEKALAMLQLKLDTSLASARNAAAAHAAQVAAERAKRQAAEQELENERTRNVTPQADALCVLTRGIVRQYNVAASIANGDERPVDASAAGPGDINAASGVAVSQLSAAIDAGAKANAACRARVKDLEDHYATVTKPWIASTLEALQLCSPKGNP